MPVINVTKSVGAGATLANVFEGSIYRTMRRPGPVVIYAVQDGNPGDITTTVTAGNAVVVNNDIVKQSSAALKGPNAPDDLLVSFAADTLDELGMSLTNGTAGALNVRIRAEIG